jgi:hypothetical protein
MNYDKSLESSVFPFLILVDYFNMCIYNPKYIPFSSIIQENSWISWIEEEENKPNKIPNIADISSVHDVDCAMIFSKSANSEKDFVVCSLTSEYIKKRYHFTINDLEDISHSYYRTKGWKPLFLRIKLKYVFRGKTKDYCTVIKYDEKNQHWKHETLKYTPSCFRVDCEGNQEMEKKRNLFFQKLSFNFSSSIFRPLLHGLLKISEICKKEQQQEKIKILIHLRMEDDAIAWWSKINHLEEEDFRVRLENKYDSMIKKIILLLTERNEGKDGEIQKKEELYFLGHKVHQHLLIQKYQQPPFLTTHYFESKPENLPREIAAIYDVQWARHCCPVYDGILFPLSGSTFSMMLKLLIPSKSFLYFDINKIDNESIFEIVD